VTDTVTGLIWLQDAARLGFHDWAAANQAAAGLKDGDCGLTDHSSGGDWRLPTKDEWSATTARAVALGCTSGNRPSLTNDAGTACLSVGPSSLAGVAWGSYWSRSPFENNFRAAWLALLASGDFYVDFKYLPALAWPVRGGSR
jgi:Protein of unknown function (DUF1566)